jgi:hypothetical protein
MCLCTVQFHGKAGRWFYQIFCIDGHKLTGIIMTLSNLLLIAGSGTKSGKTSIGCRIIEKSGLQDIFAVKISPHFHTATPGLLYLTGNESFSVWQETDINSSKDTSRLLRSGATKVFFAMVHDNQLLNAFSLIISMIPPGVPVICESPALRHFIEPGIFIIMSSEHVNKQKDISRLLEFPHIMYRLEEIDRIGSFPFYFESGRWLYSKGDR